MPLDSERRKRHKKKKKKRKKKRGSSSSDSRSSDSDNSSDSRKKKVTQIYRQTDRQQAIPQINKIWTTVLGTKTVRRIRLVIIFFYFVELDRFKNIKIDMYA